MTLPTRNVVAAEIGTSTSVRHVSRQLIQSAPPRQVANLIGSRTNLLMSVFRPWLNESISLVKRVISSEDPESEKLARSRLIVRRKNLLRISNRVFCITSATSTSWRNVNNPFKATPSMTSAIKSTSVGKLSCGRYRFT